MRLDTDNLNTAQRFVIALLGAAATGKDPRRHSPYNYLGTPKRKHRGLHTQHSQQGARLLRGRFATGDSQRATADDEVPFKHLSSAAKYRRALARAGRAA